MFGLGAPELIVILVVAVLVFGPGRLPEIGSALGKGIRDFRKAFEGHDKEAGEKLEDQSKPAGTSGEGS
jgi:sec-independent protein translocase protein TatA